MNAVAEQTEQPDPAELAYLALRTAQTRFQQPPEALEREQREAVQQQALREWVVEQRVVDSTEARELVLTESAVDTAVAELQARYPDAAAFEQALHGSGTNRAALRRVLRRQLLVEAVLEKVAARAVKVSDLDISLYYYSHGERFHSEERRSVRHILITINPDYPENTREAALRRAEALTRRLQKKPQRFAEQAIKHSECPSALHGGLLGKVTAGKLYPALDAALFAMQAGEVRGPLESEAGLHVLHCEEILPAGAVPLNEVREQIRERLQERAGQQCQRHWINGLRRRGCH